MCLYMWVFVPFCPSLRTRFVIGTLPCLWLVVITLTIAQCSHSSSGGTFDFINCQFQNDLGRCLTISGDCVANIKRCTLGANSDETRVPVTSCLHLYDQSKVPQQSLRDFHVITMTDQCWSLPNSRMFELSCSFGQQWGRKTLVALQVCIPKFSSHPIPSSSQSRQLLVSSSPPPTDLSSLGFPFTLRVRWEQHLCIEHEIEEVSQRCSALCSLLFAARWPWPTAMFWWRMEERIDGRKKTHSQSSGLGRTTRLRLSWDIACLHVGKERCGRRAVLLLGL